MKYNIFYGKSLNQNNIEILKFLQSAKDNSTENLIITPDRMTLITETNLFLVSNAKAFFNCDVTTLSRLSQKYLKREMLGKKILSKPMAVSIIKKILIENEDKFKVLTKSASINGYALNIYENICMLKSCNISPDDLTTTTQSLHLNMKLKDLLLIYEEYEAFLQNNYVDSFNRLNLFSNCITKEEFKNKNIFFLGFDDFTPQMSVILQKLIKCSNMVTVAVSSSKSSQPVKNESVFNNNLFYYLIDLGKTVGVEAQTFLVNNLFTDVQNLISSYAFANCEIPKVNNNNYFTPIKFQNRNQELEFVCKYIKNEVITKGCCYNDFTLITSDINLYAGEIKKYFLKYNIDFYLDANEKISNHSIIRFVLDFLNLMQQKLDSKLMLHFLKSYFPFKSIILSSLENELLKLGVSGKTFIEEYGLHENSAMGIIFKVLLNYYHTIEKHQPIYVWVETLKTCLNQVGLTDYISHLTQYYEQSNEMLENKKIPQVVDKLNTSFSELSILLGEDNYDFNQFYSMLSTYLDTINIVMPPIVADTVYVGDNTNSFFRENNIVIMLGANDGAVPKVLNDVGYLSDEEISYMSHRNRLSPTIKQINKRNKYKTYENLLLAKNKLIFTYIGNNEKGESLMPSNVLRSLTQLFSCLVLEGNNFLNYNEYYKNESLFLFNNVTAKDTEYNFINHIKNVKYESGSKSFVSNMDTLRLGTKTQEQVLGRNKFRNDYSLLKNTSIYFKKGTTSVSEIECYSDCAYKHFASYGLGLKQKDDESKNASVFGNILHLFVKNIMPQIISAKAECKDLNCLNINVETEMQKILDTQEYKYLRANPYHKNVIKSLIREAQQLVTALAKEQSLSRYTPTKLEYFINHSGIDICVNGKNIKIIGVIDRVDEFENNFRIIDYKTGTASFDDLSEVLIGKKIQLFVYAYVYKQESGFSPAGVFYLPIKNEFTKVGQTLGNFKLKGAVLNSLSQVVNMDNSLQNDNDKSNTLYVKVKKDGTLCGNKGAVLVSDADLTHICDYVMKLIKKSVVEINNGNIQPTPLKHKHSTACDYCPYLGLCNFHVMYGNTYRQDARKGTVNDFYEDGEE